MNTSPEAGYNNLALIPRSATATAGSSVTIGKWQYIDPQRNWLYDQITYSETLESSSHTELL